MITERVDIFEPQQVKFIYFDAGNVLYKFEGGLEELSKITGLDLGAVEKVWRGVDDSVCRGTANPEEIWTRIKSESGYKGKDINFIEFWISHFEPNNSVHQFLKLISRSFKVGLLTNKYPGVFEEELSHGYIPNINYSSVVLSCEVGYVKPETEIYYIAEKMAQVESGSLLLIDDGITNCEVAKDRGWQTYLFDKTNPNGSADELDRIFNS